MEQFELKTTVRKSIGNGPARALRREGKMPAVLYGPKTEPILLSVDIKEFETVIKKSSVGQALLNLVIQNGKEITKPAMIKELQTNPVSGNFLHVDFYEIDMERKIKVMVPIIPTGISAGVELGGLFQIVRREIEVLCLPTDIPEAYEIDITDLNIGDSVHVEDIPLGDNVEIQSDVNFTVVTIMTPKVVEEEVEEEEEVEGEEGDAEEEEASEAPEEE